MDWNQNDQNRNNYGGQNVYGNQNAYAGQNVYGDQNAYGNQNAYAGQNVYGDQNAYGNQNAYAGQNVYGNQSVYGQDVYGNQNVYGAQNAYGQSVYQGAEMQRAMFGAEQTQQGYYEEMPQQPAGVLDVVNKVMQQDVVKQSFLYMVAALVVTAISAFATRDMLLKMIVTNPASLIGLLVGELVVVFAAQSALKKNNATMGAILFTIYSFINGATIGVVLYAYTEASAASAFLMTAGMFGVMAIYGMVTNKDLTSVGSFCLMGVVGVIIASVANWFLQSEGLDFIVSIICVLLFVGLTAYDTQKIKERVRYANGQNTASLALFGALQLYLDFINIFLRLLRIMGRRK